MTDDDFFDNVEFIDEKYYRRLFGCNLKAMRLQCGLSRKKLAEKIAVSDSFIAACERGERSPKLEILFELAEALCVAIDDLLGHSNAHNEGVIDYRFERACTLVKAAGNEVAILKNGGYEIIIYEDKEKKNLDDSNGAIIFESKIALYELVEYIEELVMEGKGTFDEIALDIIDWWKNEGQNDFDKRKKLMH